MASIKTISKILIIIPAYNEAGCIEKVVDNLERNYLEMKDKDLSNFQMSCIIIKL